MSSLRKEQLKQAREALLKQIESWKGDQEGAREQINSLSDEELESFLIKNKIIKLPYGESENSAESKSPFRMIVEGKIKSYKISENDSALAVLEINPVSRGHTLIIPKEHALIQGKEKEGSIKKLMKSVSSIIKKKLKPKTSFNELVRLKPKK